MLYQLTYEVKSVRVGDILERSLIPLISMYSKIYPNRLDLVAKLVEHWTSIPKVAGSIPTVVRQTFQPARCGCTLRVTPQTSYSPEYITPTHNHGIFVVPSSNEAREYRRSNERFSRGSGELYPGEILYMVRM